MSDIESVATPRFLQGLTYAVCLHGQDVRKGTDVPYVTHLLGVCSLVLADGGDEDEAIAALLHDSLEDHANETSRAELETRFGREVLCIVEACTDTPVDYQGGKKPSWLDRKQKYLAHIPEISPRARRVALADKLDNVRAMLADYPYDDPGRVEAFWGRFNAGRDDQAWFYGELVRAFRAAGSRGAMIDEFERAVGRLQELCR